MGVQRTDDRKESFFFNELFSRRKSVFEEFSRKVRFTLSMGFTEVMAVFEKYFRKNFFHEIIFWVTFLSVGVQRSEERKEKFFLKELFSQKIFSFRKLFRKICYNLSMGPKILIMVTENYFSEKLFFKKNFFQEKNFWNDVLISGVQRIDDRK